MFARVVAALAFAGLASQLQAGGILSVTSAPGAPVVAINPATGLVQHLFNTNINLLTFGISAFDPGSRRLFFLTGGNGGSQQLVVANISSATVITRPIGIPGSYRFFEWDPGSGKVIAVTTQAAAPVVAIDPTTGTLQNLFNTNVSLSGLPLSTFDPVSRRLYFLNGSQQLIVVDLPSATVTIRTIAGSASYEFFEWDAANGKILAVTGGIGSPVVSIDPATGSVQSLFNTNISFVFPQFNAFDPISRQLYFLTGGGNNQQLVIADLSTGSVFIRSIATPDAYIFFEFDALTASVPAIQESLLIILAIALGIIGCIVQRSIRTALGIASE